VVILPDNDEPGRKHAKQVRDSLVGKAASIRILELDGLPDKGDVSNWLAAGGTKERLLELVQKAPLWKPDAGTSTGRRSRRRRREPLESDGDPLSPFHKEGQTDLANARRFVALHGCEIRYCAPQKTWYVWNGKQWLEDNTGTIYLLAKDVPDKIFH